MTISKNSGAFGGQTQTTPIKVRSRIYWEGSLGPPPPVLGPQIPSQYVRDLIFIGFVRVCPANGPDCFETVICLNYV